ncbi:MAG: hypothetical protein GQ540_03635 [Lutibacter sp.]|uniref:hypothetical protein n=1 Tax=Lutibacter sp. TaxID=1925666 RepID=UPI0019DBAF02|nr:hypothetical protein [Lutibacter sp.]NOR27604.1 hypothetical protein [Lutibacter sp.]
MGKDNKTFIILSMHRSASSLVAKGLNNAGVNMGENLLSGLADNPEGHFEDLDFLYTNIHLMNGDNWKDVNTPIKNLNMKSLIEKKDINPLWGWKDPRTILTIERYYDLLNDPIIVALFRNPEKVGMSLEKRGDMTKKEGIKLAKEYNKKLLLFLNKRFGED